MNDITAAIANNHRIARDTYRMRLVLPGEVPVSPGQFINIKLSGFYLRRPISLCDCNGCELDIIYKTVGRGTRAMSELSEGDTLDILIPLGNGFPLPDGPVEDDLFSRPLLVGGGAGVPPMFLLARKLRSFGSDPLMVMGFNTADEVFLTEEFNKAGIETILTTADGSAGVKGFVTDVMADLDRTSFFACGPEAMLRAVDAVLAGDMPGWFSFEERMGCGFGACMGCSCKTKYGSKRICKDGPILERSEVIW
ncbi:MAG: dihydroorotate dehydrogenase electron transfer subunit [Bacillota bacterium]|nr:dihydroorotate dehydrogenase electron transfer subunit [Bacillota bacterium]